MTSLQRTSAAFVLALAMLPAATAFAAPEVGAPAPAFSATDAAGRPVDLQRLRGRPVVMEWTNNGCPFVRHAYDSGVMQDLQKRAAAQGITWLTVVSSAPGNQGYLTPADAPGWKARTGAAPADIILDPKGTLGREYGAKATPTLFIVDSKGTLVYMGGLDDKPSTNPADAKTAKNYVALALADMKAGRPIADPVTRPYGCSVKY